MLAEKLGLPALPEWINKLCETHLALARKLMPDTPRTSVERK
jgi:hypothetical protein